MATGHCLCRTLYQPCTCVRQVLVYHHPCVSVSENSSQVVTLYSSAKLVYTTVGRDFHLERGTRPYCEDSIA